MQTRRDQVQAYRFAQARLQAAVLGAEPDRAESPMRRSGIAGFAGVMVAALVVAGFGVLGLVRPSGKAGWDAPGVVVVEKETGTRFVFDRTDGALHPVLNFASARLALQTPSVTVKQFSRASLRGVPRGAARGIVGAPDALAPADALIAGPWSVCSGVADGSSGRPQLSVSVGSAPTGIRVSGDAAVVVRSQDDGRIYLVWNDRRLLVPDANKVLAVFGASSWQPVTVSSRWLNAITPGHDLVAPVPTRTGAAVDYRVGTRVVYLGQVLRTKVEGTLDTKYFVVLADGVSPVSDVLAQLLLVDPRTRLAYGNQTPVALDAESADIAASPKAGTALPASGLPVSFPQDAVAAAAASGAPATHICGVFTDSIGAESTAKVYLTRGVPGAPAGATAASGAGQGDGSADQWVEVHVPPGSAALVNPLVNPGVRSTATFLVTDLGARFPVPPGSALAALGYGGVTPAPVPQGILDLLPTGPPLDPTRANVDQSVGTAIGAAVRP